MVCRKMMLLFIIFVWGCFATILAQESKLSYGADLGVSILVYPHQDFRNSFDDALYNPGFRVAGNITYGKIRLEHNMSYSQYQNDKSNSRVYQSNTYDKIATKLDILQQGTSLLFVKNTDERVSFIGLGALVINGKEQLTLHTETTKRFISNNTNGAGYQLLVGGRDKDSLLKVILSYTSARLTSILGHSYDAGGYSFSFQVAFDSIK